MNGLPICGYALAGAGSEHAPESRRVALPPPGLKRSGGRLPRLAIALAEATGVAQDPERESVLFGTGLGCQTETAAFLEHLMAAEEATPKPRAFAASVHNAIASSVALKRGAKGECQTFAHGEASFAQALAAARATHTRTRGASLIVGGVDESSAYVDRGIESCGLAATPGEGGGVIRIDTTAQTIATITEVRLGRPKSPSDFLREGLASTTALVAVPGLHASPVPGAKPALATTHQSLSATALGLAIGILRREVSPTALGLDPGSTSIALAILTRWGDVARILVEAAD